MGEHDGARFLLGCGPLAFVALAGCGPRVPDDALDGVTRLSGGGEMSCAHRDDGSTWCWGQESLTHAPAEKSYARRVATEHIRETRRGFVTWVVFDDGTVAVEDVAAGALERVPALTNVAELAIGVIVCARRTDDVVLCSSGEGFHRVEGLPPIQSISSGWDTALAVGRDGSVWRIRGHREVTPMAISDGVAVASASSYHCVLHSSGEVSCLADRRSEHVPFLDRDVPKRIGGVAHAKRIVTGAQRACAVIEDGSVSCWGSYDPNIDAHDHGWLEASPMPLAKGARDVLVDSFHTCFVTPEGRVLCAGYFYELGAGLDFSSRGPRGFEYARTDLPDDGAAMRRRQAWLAPLVFAIAIAAMLLHGLRVARRASWPGGTVKMGDGYREGGELPLADIRPPAVVRVALVLGLASAGADAAVAACVIWLAGVGVSPGLAFAGLLAWLTFVTKSAIDAARGALGALKRLPWLGAVQLAHLGIAFALWKTHGGPLAIELAIASALGVATAMAFVLAYARGKNELRAG